EIERHGVTGHDHTAQVRAAAHHDRHGTVGDTVRGERQQRPRMLDAARAREHGTRYAFESRARNAIADAGHVPRHHLSFGMTMLRSMASRMPITMPSVTRMRSACGMASNAPGGAAWMPRPTASDAARISASRRDVMLRPMMSMPTDATMPNMNSSTPPSTALGISAMMAPTLGTIAISIR